MTTYNIFYNSNKEIVWSTTGNVDDGIKTPENSKHVISSEGENAGDGKPQSSKKKSRQSDDGDTTDIKNMLSFLVTETQKTSGVISNIQSEIQFMYVLMY